MCRRLYRIVILQEMCREFWCILILQEMNRRLYRILILQEMCHEFWCILILQEICRGYSVSFFCSKCTVSYGVRFLAYFTGNVLLFMLYSRKVSYPFLTEKCHELWFTF